MAQAGYNFSTYISERTQNFTKREWVFEKINNWLEDAQGGRIFLLTGNPGTGKSSVAARLAQMSLGSVDAARYPRLGKDRLAYFHFCVAQSDVTLNPLRFVEALSSALANRYPAFRNAIESLGSKQIIFNISQPVGNVQSGGLVIGAQVQIEIKSGDARPMFDLAVRLPLQKLCENPPDERIVFIIDSLDEALTFNSDNNIVQLLKLIDDFPSEVRFICTCRSKNDRVFEIIGKKPTLDLLADAPADLDEVKSFAIERLGALPEPSRSGIASRIAEKSMGNFLYAYHVLNDLLAQNLTIVDPAALILPDTLEDVYRKFVERELAFNPTRWNDVYRPLLGLIAVARGNGLTKMQLISITNLAEDTADEVFKVCAQYLMGGETEEDPYRIYHQSFREFLLIDKKYTVYPAERHLSIARYLEEQYGSNWSTCKDEYALRYTPTHWAYAAEMSKVNPEMRIQALINLTQNQKYQRRFERLIGDIPALKQHLHRAVQVATISDRDDMLPWLIKAPQGYVAFHRDFLKGESVARLAEEGKSDEAVARLRLFNEIDEDWQVAARLIIAWLGAEGNVTAAEKLYTQTVKTAPSTDPLPLLMERIGAALKNTPKFQFEDAPSVSLAVAQQLVKRISGQEVDREMLFSINPSLILTETPSSQSEMISQQGYAAGLDAPILVNTARVHGEAGTALVDEYIDAHASYNYVEYRNRSLWIVLHAVLRHHPDQHWVRERLRRILIAALTGGGMDFREMLPLTTALLREKATTGNERSVLEKRCSHALDTAHGLQNRHNANDSWGNHKRRLTAFMELFQLLSSDTPKAYFLLDRIRGLPDGFAGFQAPAYLRLADALRACTMSNSDLLDGTLKNAIITAHRIKDFSFCARITARCNALKRWHMTALTGQQLTDTISRFTAFPSEVEFAADHFIHESYPYRNTTDPHMLTIMPAQQAETLDQLVVVFQRPAVEFRRLNPQYGLTQTLCDKTLIHVPDPGFAPLLANHLGARVIADATLDDERGALLRSLVPVAANNPTVLDTLLSYLLIANQPDDIELLEEISREAGPIIFDNSTQSMAQRGPDVATRINLS